MNWRQTMLVGTLLVTGLGLLGCGEDIPITTTTPEPALADIPFEETRKNAGERLYDSLCFGCHQDSGQARQGNITPILPTIYGTAAAVEDDRLAERTARTMPEGNADACDYECGLNIQHYFYSLWSSPAGQEPDPNAPVSQAESDNRVSAGLTLYGSEGCGACHGDDGTQAGFDIIVDSTRTYNSVRNIIQLGAGLMPACEAENCASQIADYVWVEFLGGTLTESGGIR